MAAESLREYLVKLGWDVDEKGFKESMDKMSGFEAKSKSLFGKMRESAVSAGGAIFSALTGITKVTVGLISTTANADLEMERFARKMWTTENRARSFATALRAVNSDMSDIYWMTNEEFNRFMDLRDLGSSLEAPQELNETLVKIRDIQHEFNRLKVIANYGTQWVVYYLGKYLGVEIDEIHGKFKSFNDWVASNLPQITQKIAKFLSTFVKLAEAGVKFGVSLWNILTKLWSKMSEGTRATVTLGASFLALLKMGPIGLFIAALTTLLLLLDDYYGWKEGKDSALPGLWQGIADWKNGLKETGELDKFISKVDNLGTSFFNLLKALAEFGQKAWKWADDVGILKGAWELFSGILEGVAGFLQTIADLLNLITGNVEGKGDDENSFIATNKVYNPETGEVEEQVDGWKTAKNMLDGVFGWMRGPALGWLESEPESGTGFFRNPMISGGFSGVSSSFGGQRGSAEFNGTINQYITTQPGQSEESVAKKSAERVVEAIKQNIPFR